MKSFNTFIKDADDLNEGSFQSLLKTGSMVVLVFRPVCSLVKMDQSFILGC